MAIEDKQHAAYAARLAARKVAVVEPPEPVTEPATEPGITTPRRRGRPPKPQGVVQS